MNTLYDKLDNYAKSDYIPFHMPGHKRNYEKFGLESAAGIDITEIEGFDDYHYPQGIIREIEQQASRVYGSDYSFYLVNGSTSGLLTAISAMVSYGDRIIVARNCHRAVYNAIYLNGLVPEYIYPVIDPEYGVMGQILPEDIKQALKTSKAKVVVVTSPTYEGLLSSIEEIATVCHEHGAALIIDAAHGAHFNFSDEFPKTAVRCGADIVIESLHKTLPSYTQTAILHVSGRYADITKIKRYLSIYQTSSPSYIFMGGINKCIDYMTSRQGREENGKYIAELRNLRENIKKLCNIKLYPDATEKNNVYYDYDISKIVLYSKGKGVYIYEQLLHKYHIQAEMAAADYIIAMTSIGDDFCWYKKFLNALLEIDREITESNQKNNDDESDNKSRQYNDKMYEIVRAKVKLSPREALGREGVEIPLFQSIGKITLEWAYAYPPGIPLIYPGEEITEELLNKMMTMRKAGVYIKGFRDEKGEKILCIK